MSDLIKLKDFSILSKADLQAQGEGKAKELIEGGYYDAVVLIVQARKANEYLSSFIKALDSQARKEVNEEYNGDAQIYGANLSIGSTGDRLDLEVDVEYKRIKEALAERAKWLKIASKDTTTEVVIDGAVVKPVPIKSASKELLKIRL